jgi:hypothetical protein
VFDPDALTTIEDAIDKLAVCEQAIDVARLKRCADRLEGLWLREVGRADRDGRLVELHHSSTGVLMLSCRLSHGAAKRSLGFARSLRELPETTAALVDGSVTHEHARVLAAAYTPARACELRDLEPKLVDIAQRFETRDLKVVVRRLIDAIDGDGGATGANHDWERRSLHFSPSSFGLAGVRGDLVPDAAETLSAAIETRMEDDKDALGNARRTRAQRRHDALRDVAQFYLSHRHRRVPSRRRGAPHVGVMIDLALLRSAGHRDVADAIRGDLEHVGAVSAATLRRLTCDCSLYRVITDGPSLVIDVGRATRHIPTGLFRALVARDGGCTEPGCNAPPGWCEVHHDKHWADGGETSLSNCRLRCWRHHRDDHEGATARSP